MGNELSSMFDCLMKMVANKHLQGFAASLNDILRRCLAALYIDSYVIFTTIEDIRLFIMHMFEERYGCKVEHRPIMDIKSCFPKYIDTRLDFK